MSHRISGVGDLRTYLQNSHPDVCEWEGLPERVVSAIQAADHPPYNTQWGAWLVANLPAIVEQATQAFHTHDFERRWLAECRAHGETQRKLEQTEATLASIRLLLGQVAP